MIVVPPGFEPAVTMPLATPTLAIALLALLQVPPVVASASADVLPAHMLVLPDIVAGNALTVSIFDATHPAADV